MPQPTEEQLEEMLALCRMVRMMVMTLSSSHSITLSVYYTLFVEAMIATAMAEQNFDNVMVQLRRDRDRWDAMLKATNAQELLEIAKFTADVVISDQPTPEPS